MLLKESNKKLNYISFVILGTATWPIVGAQPWSRDLLLRKEDDGTALPA